MNPNQNKPGRPVQNKPNNGCNIFHLLIIGFIITFFINMLVARFALNSKIQIDYSQFIKLADSGVINQVQIEDTQILVTLKPDADQAVINDIFGIDPSTEQPANGWQDQNRQSRVYYTARLDDPGLTDRLLAQADLSFGGVIVESSPIFNFIISWIIPIVLMYFIFSLFLRGLSRRMGEGGGMGGMMSIGKSKAKEYNIQKNTGVTFKDVAGQDEAKESLLEIVDLLQHPEKYDKIGAKSPKGALLVGPPGTGKTLLAKAVAGEAGVPFFSISGSEFVEMFVGVGASRVRDLFTQANKQAPCIIFIDEIDAIGKRRDHQMSSNDEREQTLNQLLSEMDGFDSSKGIVVLAATNRPEILDKALLRPGRFDRQIIVDKPDLPGRESILRVHANRVSLEPDVKLKEIALATSGATGADLMNMVNEAALRAVRMDRHAVTQEDLMESVELVIAGKEKKDRILGPKEKRMVAYHEVGHALASALQKDSQPVQKITIVPRTMGALGYTMNMPEEERYLLTKSELMAQITTLLAGRAAEEIGLGESSTGASNDIEHATKLARSMVTQYGMSERFDMMALENTQNQYLDGRSVTTCSEATGAQIDDEVRAIIIFCHEESLKLLRSNHQKLGEIAEYLIEKESITGEQFMNILNSQGKIV